MDDYFNWYLMSEYHKVRFVKIKLAGQAKLYWNTIEHQYYLMCLEPIGTWEGMKKKLKEKYLPLSYHSRLMDQWNSLRQGRISISDYIACFNELMWRCDIIEDPVATLSRFRLGLHPEF